MLLGSVWCYKPLSQKHGSTFLPLQDADPTPSFGGFGFREAASQLEEVDGILVRVDRSGDQMRAIEYSEKNLQVAASQRIEVR